jgi:hypothetical protein
VPKSLEETNALFTFDSKMCWAQRAGFDSRVWLVIQLKFFVYMLAYVISKFWPDLFTHLFKLYSYTRFCSSNNGAWICTSVKFDNWLTPPENVTGLNLFNVPSYWITYWSIAGTLLSKSYAFAIVLVVGGSCVFTHL